MRDHSDTERQTDQQQRLGELVGSLRRLQERLEGFERAQRFLVAYNRALWHALRASVQQERDGDELLSALEAAHVAASSAEPHLRNPRDREDLSRALICITEVVRAVQTTGGLDRRASNTTRGES